MDLLEEYGVEEVNQYILEQTDFVEEAAESLSGGDKDLHYVAMALRGVEEQKDVEILDRVHRESFYVDELGIEYTGENLERLREFEMIRMENGSVNGKMKKDSNIPLVKSTELANLYLKQLSSVNDGEIERYAG